MPEYRSLAEYFLTNSRKHSEKIAYVIRRRIKKEVIFYAEIPKLIGQFNTLLSAHHPSRPVLIWAPNCPEYALSLIACFSIGRTVVPIDYRTNTDTLQKIIKETKPGVIITSKFLNRSIFPPNVPFFFIEEIIDTLRVLKETKVRAHRTPPGASEIVYTSGTTNTPKGVVLTQTNFLHELALLKDRLPDLKEARIISVLPLSHIYEQLTGLILPFQAGATVFYVTRLNSYRVLEAFREYLPTHQTFVPQMLRLFMNKIEEKAASQGKLHTLQKLLAISQPFPLFLRRLLFKDVHSQFGGKLKMIASGGAPLDYELAKKWHALGFTLIQGYGATETTGVVTMTDPSDSPPSTVGKPLADLQIKLSSDGEIIVKGPTISSGYHQKPQQTHQQFTIDGYRTGDIGFIDNKGNVQIKGRNAFKIVLENGEKVYVEDLEKVLLLHPDVLDACVTAKQKNKSDTIHCLIILKPASKNTVTSVIAWANQQLESKQQITSYEEWPQGDFPRTQTLKIDRKKISAYINHTESAEDATTTTQSAMSDVVDIIALLSHNPRGKIKKQHTLATDLKLDSLARLELTSLIEENLGIIINESDINQSTTVGDLEKMVGNSSQKIEQPYFPTWHFTWWGVLLRKVIVKGLLRPLYNQIITIEYPQKKVPKIPPGSIVIFNHPGVMDGACVVNTLLNQGQFNYFTNAHDELWFPKGWIALFNELGSGAIPIYKSGHKLQKTLQLDADLLAQGFNLLFAPQGRQQRQDAEDPFQPGIGYLVKELDVPVVIVKIKGYREIWPAPATDIKDSSLRSLLPRKRGKVQVYVSKPIKDKWSAYTSQQITELLENKYLTLEQES